MYIAKLKFGLHNVYLVIDIVGNKGNTSENGLLCGVNIPEILVEQYVMAKSSSTKSYLVCWSVSWFVWSFYPMLGLLAGFPED